METGLHCWVLEMDGNYRPVRGAGCSPCWCQHKSGAGPWLEHSQELTPSPVFLASSEEGELQGAGKRSRMRPPRGESSCSGEMGGAESLEKSSANVMEGTGTQPIHRRDLQCRAGGLGRARATYTSVPEDFPGRGEPQGGVFVALNYAQRSPPARWCWCWGGWSLWRSGAQGQFTVCTVCPDGGGLCCTWQCFQIP